MPRWFEYWNQVQESDPDICDECAEGEYCSKCFDDPNDGGKHMFYFKKKSSASENTLIVTIMWFFVIWIFVMCEIGDGGTVHGILPLVLASIVPLVVSLVWFIRKK